MKGTLKFKELGGEDKMNAVRTICDRMYKAVKCDEEILFDVLNTENIRIEFTWVSYACEGYRRGDFRISDEDAGLFFQSVARNI